MPKFMLGICLLVLLLAALFITRGIPRTNHGANGIQVLRLTRGTSRADLGLIEELYRGENRTVRMTVRNDTDMKLPTEYTA